MAKFICAICGYVYDESAGNPERGIAKGTKWEDLPEGWRCPVCGAGKDAFAPDASERKQPRRDAESPRNPYERGASETPKQNDRDISETPKQTRPDASRSFKPGETGFRTSDFGTPKEGFSYGLISVLCSNFARGTEKQYRAEESKLWTELADYYHALSKRETGSLSETRAKNEEDAEAFPAAKSLASETGDRGALRALVWSEKVTAALKSIYSRYETEGEELLKDTRIYVCEICGFVYLGNEPPEICPVCKVPKLKIKEARRSL